MGVKDLGAKDLGAKVVCQTELTLMRMCERVVDAQGGGTEVSIYICGTCFLFCLAESHLHEKW